MPGSEPVFTGWRDEHAALFGRHLVRVNHRLHASPLFFEETLARLIETCDPACYNLVRMGDAGAPKEWREGEIGARSGLEVIEAIRRGRMWINLRSVGRFDARYAELTERIFAELEARVPGLRTFRHTLGILISSPGAQVYYHADVTGQSLWQIRGRKRVYLYPAAEPFLPPEALEGIVLKETEEDLPYEPWFDDHALALDLEPGEMLTMPLNAPHRVVNHDCLNVSFTTEHWTPAIRRSYAVNYANGVLRRRLGWRPRSRATEGLSVYPKAALALAWKTAGFQRGRTYDRVIRFRVDPGAAGGCVDIPAYRRG